MPIHAITAWLVHFMFKLLAGHCPEVLALIDEEHFNQSFSAGDDTGDSPVPAAIRATLAEYDFTRYRSSWASGLYPENVDMNGGDDRTDEPFASSSGSAWWYQQPGSKREYLPLAIDKINPSVQQFLEAHGLPTSSDGKGHYLSSDDLRYKCHAAAPTFHTFVDESLQYWGVPSVLRSPIASSTMPLRAMACDAVIVRSFLADLTPSDSTGCAQAVSTVIVIMASVAAGALS